MKDDFHTPDPADADHMDDADVPENFDDIEISALPPDRRSHYLLLGLSKIKQRLLTTIQHVSRATWRDVAQIAGDGQANSDEFELEWSELPPTRRSHVLLLKLKRWLAPRAQGARSFPRAAAAPVRRSLAGRVISVFAMCVVLLALLFSAVPDLRNGVLGLFTPASVSTGTAYVSTDLSGIDANVPVIVYPYGTPPASFQSSPGAIPTTCPHMSTLQYFTSPLDPPGLGDGSVWISGFSGPSPVLDHLTPFPKPDQGWYQVLTIFIQRGFSTTISIQGSAQSTHQPIWFGKSDPSALTDSLFFNLNDGTRYLTPFPRWAMTTIIVSVPAAGCYSLQASWANHTWKRYFAAGA